MMNEMNINRLQKCSMLSQIQRKFYFVLSTSSYFSITEQTWKGTVTSSIVLYNHSLRPIWILLHIKHLTVQIQCINRNLQLPIHFNHYYNVIHIRTLTTAYILFFQLSCRSFRYSTKSSEIITNPRVTPTSKHIFTKLKEALLLY